MCTQYTCHNIFFLNVLYRRRKVCLCLGMYNIVVTHITKNIHINKFEDKSEFSYRQLNFSNPIGFTQLLLFIFIWFGNFTRDGVQNNSIGNT